MGSKILAARGETYTELKSTAKDSKAEYMYVVVKAPLLAGATLKCFTWLLETAVTGSILLPKLKRDNLITKTFMESRYKEPPMYSPQYPREIEEQVQEKMVQRVEAGSSPAQRVAAAVQALPSYCEPPSNRCSEKHEFRYWTIRDYAHAYTSGRVTPTQVAERFLSAVEDSCKLGPGMGLFISLDAQDVLRQAAAATERYQQGRPLSVLDGVPVAVKDEIDCLPHPTTGGSTWLANVRHAKEDAVAVKRLRECGAVMVGKTNMHELGMGTTGINPHYGASRNPYDKARVSGGSSGGSAATVAAGLCPAALGVDGGGSVRMPAGLCGVVGLKPTFGRVSSSGVLPLNWTVGMLGTLTASVEDASIMYAAMLGHLHTDRISSIPLPANLPLLKNSQEDSLSMAKLMGDLRFAKYSKWFNDTDVPIQHVCDRALDLLQKSFGCKVVEVTIPEIEEMRLAHFITIGSEALTSLGLDYRHLGLKSSGADVRVSCAIFGSFCNQEFIAAQRMRFRQMHYHNEIFKEADIIVSPTTGATAPLVRGVAEQCGELDYGVGAKLMRFQIAGNLLGLPAISIPVGHDNNGLPIGLQLIGRPWSEATLLQVAIHLERLCAHYRERPEVFYDLLQSQMAACKHGILPEGVVEQILVLLPPRSLARCRAVSKHWDMLISSGRFIKLLCCAQDKSMHRIAPIEVYFVKGLLTEEEFRKPFALKKSSWTTIWDQLIASVYLS